MENEWAIDSNASDVIIKSRHSLIDYMSGNKNNFKGHVAIENDQVEDASIEFLLNVNNKNTQNDFKLIDFFNYDETPVIQFKSTSFQKINKNINFLKGYLTIKNITNGVQKASFEITGNINRKDFGLNYNPYSNHGGHAAGSDIKLIANLAFTH
jgi:polyisoprenoid-binding protein YceI